MSKNPSLSRMRRRIWWSIYVRERQAAASLGLPSRIRDEDCDIEVLTAADLETDMDIAYSSLFGSCEREHITYVIKMVEIARLRKSCNSSSQLLKAQRGQALRQEAPGGNYNC